MARGRARRRRRLTGLGVAGTAAATAAALGLAGVLGGGAGPAPASATIRTAAFTLAQNANGTDTLTLSQSQLFDPSALQQALARDGIPALVKIGTYCSSYPAPPRPSSIGVISVRQPDGTPAAKSSPGDQNPVLAGAVTVINPAKMPAGTELFFDYIHHGLVGSLIYTNSYTCTSGFPHGGPPAS
jgi:hypothetical protein